MILVIGSNDEQLSVFAKRIHSHNFLVTEESFSKVLTNIDGCAYTSLADLSEGNIIKLALVAKSIHYFPPPNGWKSKEFEAATRRLLTKLIKFFNLKIRNFVPDSDPTNSLEQYDQRKTDDKQLWVVGCSFAHGFGLEFESQRYIHIVAKELQLEYSDLTSPGSSVDWAADQILRADIRPDDIVIWGLTGTNRVNYYVNNSYTMIIPEFLPKNNTNFFRKLITDDNRVNQTIKLIHQVINFINKIGAKLIILDHSEELSLFEHKEILNEYLWNFDFVISPSDGIDATYDDHPGPLTNQLWANQLINFIKSPKV